MENGINGRLGNGERPGAENSKANRFIYLLPRRFNALDKRSYWDRSSGVRSGDRGHALQLGYSIVIAGTQASLAVRLKRVY